ncbi:hypothetical protein [Clostridium sp. YIM B02551]|nr:hypothetical protein [Clostridium sp. YIM B02551]
MERIELENVSDFTLGEENVAFAHLSLSVPKEASSNEWLEPVIDKEYSKL